MMPFKDEYIYWKSEVLTWKFRFISCKGCYFIGENPMYICKGRKFRSKFSCAKYNFGGGIFVKYDGFL